ncbi:YkvA family protein [Halobacillus sp. B23F22_1]|uniref:YkvA family protein n=1 Tax=Halobacillus sp. B23F22_1 TaxID=3459514 RepID=UPI00373FA6B2
MWRMWRRIKFLANLKKSIPFLIRFFRSEEVGIDKKVISVAMMVGYIAFPWDLIPDFFIFIGLIDDAAVLTFILQQIVKMAPSSLKEEFQLEKEDKV